ncbi:MAG: hypothetical protein M9894_20660 [Planctomycetes bacterium]|nr:hypothetical protein [Planctomycetota bacterium]
MTLTGPIRRCRAAVVLLALVALPWMLAPAVARAGDPPAPAPAKQAACPRCEAALPADGWCGACNVGVARGVETTCRSCLTAVQQDGWCDGCRVGYVGAKKTTCRACFDLMGAEDGGWCEGCKVGHARGLKTSCRACLTAIQRDGWCDGCRVGYVGAKRTTCRACFDLMGTEDGGWCEGCNVGHARGQKTSCRACLIAIRQDGRCDGCKVRFEGGRALKQYTVRLRTAPHDHEEGHEHVAPGPAIREALAPLGATQLTFDERRGEARFELDRAREPALRRALAGLRAQGLEATLGQ